MGGMRVNYVSLHLVRKSKKRAYIDSLKILCN